MSNELKLLAASTPLSVAASQNNNNKGGVYSVTYLAPLKLYNMYMDMDMYLCAYTAC